MSLAQLKPAERRAHPRTEADASGVIGYGPPAASVKCRIVDRSVSGARVRIAAKYQLPRRVFLVDEEIGAVFESVIAWRNDTHMGLAFVTVRRLATRR